MDEKVLETTMNEGAVVKTEFEDQMPAETSTKTGINWKKAGTITAVTMFVIGLGGLLIKKFVVDPKKAKKAAQAEATDEVVESTDEEK